MSVKIRLAQTGKKNSRTYRVVAMDESQKRDGRYLELLGNVTYLTKDKYTSKVNTERINYWISRGARVTEATKKYLQKS